MGVHPSHPVVTDDHVVTKNMVTWGSCWETPISIHFQFYKTQPQHPAAQPDSTSAKRSVKSRLRVTAAKHEIKGVLGGAASASIDL